MGDNFIYEFMNNTNATLADFCRTLSIKFIIVDSLYRIISRNLKYLFKSSWDSPISLYGKHFEKWLSTSTSGKLMQMIVAQ